MDKFAQFYCSKASDIRKCPNPECHYAGSIDFYKCKEPLECESCKTQWYDPIHN